MPKITIVTDSTTNLSKDYTEKHNVRIVPLNVHWGDETFKDGVNITPTEFYQRLESSSIHPQTSQPSMQEFKNAFEELAPDCEAIIAPLTASALSGTIASAQSAQLEFSAVPLEIIDTNEIAAGLALVVMAVADAIETGKDLEEVKQIAVDVSSRVRFYFMVDTLDYLHRGGRIGGGRRFLGTALKIKPILYLSDEGKIEALEQVRTKRKALARMLELVKEEAAGKPAHIGIIHANALEDAKDFREKIKASVDCKFLEIYDLSPVIGVHVGPGTVGFCIYTET